uniref:Uncharacterized protein n=1 Tax=Plectus sambesii TaxID=2011161 RepID=A0A914VC80_9BILA
MAEKSASDEGDYGSGGSKQTFLQSWTETLKKALPGSNEKDEKPAVLKEFSLKGVAKFIKKE